MKLNHHFQTAHALFFVLTSLFILNSCFNLSDQDLVNLEGVIFEEGSKPGTSINQKQYQTITQLIKATSSATSTSPLSINYPHNKSIFPPEFTEPTFLWIDLNKESNFWLIEIAFNDGSPKLYTVTRGKPFPAPEIDERCLIPNTDLVLPDPKHDITWKPATTFWTTIKKQSLGKNVDITLYGFNKKTSKEVLSKGLVSFKTSPDSVGAPIFYRDVPVMPIKNETGVIMPISRIALPLVTWRLRDVSLPRSKIVMNHIPTCANCHSFSNDGKWMGSDIDGPESDKGGYALLPIQKKMTINKNEMFSWNYDFKNNPKRQRTIGFLSQVSPDGENVVTTLNEELFVIGYLTPAYSQVFYPTRGELAYYSKQNKRIRLLPGGDNTDYVHCNPVWTPDGKRIVFSRARARDPYVKGQRMPAYPNAPEETPIKYDLYIMDFNNGKGGIPQPILGASNNGMSNNFPKVSPDGKWIVWVQCRNGLLMRPDSKLWIVPLEGGEAREMICNTKEMNSWHSWSPNNRWMVFSSKVNTFYTQLFLTHIDENGISSPPIFLPHSTADNRAVNIPEFVNINYEDMQNIEVPAVNHFWHIRAADSMIFLDKKSEAIAHLEKALPFTIDLKVKASIFTHLGGIAPDNKKAFDYLHRALQADPEYDEAWFVKAANEQKA
ncbi:MAG: PD40 domain-containing protein, partial [Fibrobacteria bacterium]|nr:PD40 domain-containing protein [Fibrobacteria bacterium]